ncbi:hypothetical protein [Geomonas agri]|uniref:hypothetical protein n=1 Tax=Geomonas agri TaxID=2873702 RepID=UPI001CD25DA7|nr:hypothetical protein [Geomonas agri]
MKRTDSSKTPKPKYRKIDQGDPVIANRIREFSERTRFPRYCIVDLMVKGALSPDLNSECDIHMRDFVLPTLLKNRIFLKATLSKIGGHEAQLKFVDSLREDSPFHDYIRSRFLKLQQGQKTLRLEMVIADLRSCGPYIKLSKNTDDAMLIKVIKKIKNKLQLIENRNRKKSGQHRKLDWLREQLVITISSTKLFGDDFDFIAALSTAKTYNSRTIGAKLDEIGNNYPFTVDERTNILKTAAMRAFQHIQGELPSDKIDIVLGPGTSARLIAYSADRSGSKDGHKASLSQIFYKLWWVKEVFEDYSIDLEIPEIMLDSVD